MMSILAPTPHFVYRVEVGIESLSEAIRGFRLAYEARNRGALSLIRAVVICDRLYEGAIIGHALQRPAPWKSQRPIEDHEPDPVIFDLRSGERECPMHRKLLHRRGVLRFQDNLIPCVAQIETAGAPTQIDRNEQITQMVARKFTPAV